MYQIQKATYNKIQQHIIKEKKKNLLFFSPLQPSQHILEKDIKYRMVRKTQSSSLFVFYKVTSLSQSINPLVTNRHTLLTQSSGIPDLVTETFKVVSTRF